MEPDDYLAVIGQLPKLRMNFFGLHTYPEERPNAEPTVWIGLQSDIGADGKVKFSYPSSYMNTLRGNWGYARGEDERLRLRQRSALRARRLRAGGNVRLHAVADYARGKQ